MAKRIPIALILAAAAVVVLALWWWQRPPAFTLGTNADRNVLLISIDTLRADALGSYGGRATTPNLDRLAAQGARFEFAHAHAVVTLVSHASLLTGRYPYEHGIRDNTGYRLKPGQQTAATLLKTAGFATGAFIGGFPLDHRFGLNAGFDVYDDNLSPAASAADAGERERRADAVVTSALQWIGLQNTKWFGFVHVYDPHATYDPPAPWAARFSTDPYLGEVSFTDAALGTMLGRLATQPRPTLVIVTADHGESLGEHGESTHSLFAYEATLRVPLIVGEVGGQQSDRRGVTIATPVRHVDLLPTMLDAVGANPPVRRDLPGASLRDLIAAGRGPDRPSYFESMTSTITRGWAPLRGVVAGREKYIDLPIAELYDLSTDAGELQNLTAARANRVPVLVNTLKSFSVAPPGRPREETADTVERLRSLGYIGGGAAPVREKYTEADDPKRLIELEQTMSRAAAAGREGRPDEAIALFKSVIAKRPDTEDAYRKLALVYWRTGRPGLAIATLEDALRHGITQREVTIKLGQYLSLSGQAPKAIHLLEAFAGDDPDALIALGNAYIGADRRPDAIRTFKRLIRVDPRNGLAYENMGIAQGQAGDFTAAEASLRRALEIDSSLAGAYKGLGVVLFNTRRPAEAIDAWKRAVDLDEAEFDALFNLTKTLAETGRRDEAKAYGERFIRTAPPALAQDAATVRRLIGK